MARNKMKKNKKSEQEALYHEKIGILYPPREAGRRERSV